MNVMGVEMTPDVRAWEAPQRRIGALGVLALTALLLLAGVIVWFATDGGAAGLYWTLAVVVLLALVFLVMLFVLPMPSDDAAETLDEGDVSAGEGGVWTADDHDAFRPPAGGADDDDDDDLGADLDDDRILDDADDPHAAAPAAAVTLTLRCGDCGTIFDVADTGVRPLLHSCPGCGAEGALDDVPEPSDADASQAAEAGHGDGHGAATAAPASDAMDDDDLDAGLDDDFDAPAAAPAMAPPPAATPAPAPPSNKPLKLRCGSCKGVFSIEDDGTRPLRRPCPHCGKIGEIR